MDLFKKTASSARMACDARTITTYVVSIALTLASAIALAVIAAVAALAVPLQRLIKETRKA